MCARMCVSLNVDDDVRALCNGVRYKSPANVSCQKYGYVDIATRTRDFDSALRPATHITPFCTPFLSEA